MGVWVTLALVFTLAPPLGSGENLFLLFEHHHLQRYLEFSSLSFHSIHGKVYCSVQHHCHHPQHLHHPQRVVHHQGGVLFRPHGKDPGSSPALAKKGFLLMQLQFHIRLDAAICKRHTKSEGLNFVTPFLKFRVSALRVFGRMTAFSSSKRGDHTFSIVCPSEFFYSNTCFNLYKERWSYFLNVTSRIFLFFSKYFFLFKEMWSYFLNAVSFKFCLIFKERWSYFIHCVHCVHCIYCAHFGQTYLIWVKPHSFVQQQNVNLESLKSFSAIFFLCLESFIFFFFIIAATFFRGIERTRAYD